MARISVVLAGVLVFASWSLTSAPGDGQEDRRARQYTVSPIGFVRTAGTKTTIVLEKQYEPGLLGLEGYSHINVYWWFDRNDTPERRATLQVHPNPPGNMAHPLTGVFATRSPLRPNLIGATVCRLIAVKANVIEIAAIDAFPDTPVLDIKGHVPRLDGVSNATVPWWIGRSQGGR
jgi:tRNA-Thr(GGU) m(6)t(6)A37 methyltransferase TsaA